MSAMGRRLRARVQLGEDRERLADRRRRARRAPWRWRVGSQRAVARGGRARSASSASAKSGPRSVAKTESSSSGHSIAASAFRSATTSSRLWNERPPTSTCGDAPLLERAHVGARHVLAEARRSGGTGGTRGAPRWARVCPSRSVIVQPLSRISQSTNAPHGVGQRLGHLPLRHLAGLVRVRARHRERDDRRLVRRILPEGFERARTRPGCRPRCPASAARTAALTALWIAGALRKLVVQVQELARPARASCCFTRS